MSDTSLYLLLAAGAVLVVVEHAALVFIGYLASRRVLREEIEENRRLRNRLAAAEAIIDDCERRGYLQTTTSGKHRAEGGGDGA